MTGLLQRFLRKLLKTSRLELLPVHVRGGLSRGAWWTLYPWSSYWRGTHEPALQSFLASLGGKDIEGCVCWDLGAHFGIYSVGLARRVGKSGQVAAFEPDPVSFARLARHRDLNKLTQLKVFRAAVSDSRREDDLFTYGRSGSTTAHLRYGGELGVGGKPIRVATVRLDELVESGEIRAPDFIKVDVEGHGHRALAGAMRTIVTKLPSILVAFHSVEEREGIERLLIPVGYNMERVFGAEEYIFQAERHKEIQGAR